MILSNVSLTKILAQKDVRYDEQVWINFKISALS